MQNLLNHTSLLMRNRYLSSPVNRAVEVAVQSATLKLNLDISSLLENKPLKWRLTKKSNSGVHSNRAYSSQLKCLKSHKCMGWIATWGILIGQGDCSWRKRLQRRKFRVRSTCKKCTEDPFMILIIYPFFILIFLQLILMNSLPIPNMNNPFPNHLRRNSHSSHLLTPEKPTTSQN